MKVIDIRTGEATASAGDEGEDSDSGSVQVVLTEAERQALLKACEKYRHSIPAYIQSKQEELSLIKAIIDKLS